MSIKISDKHYSPSQSIRCVHMFLTCVVLPLKIFIFTPETELLREAVLIKAEPASDRKIMGTKIKSMIQFT